MFGRTSYLDIATRKTEIDKALASLKRVARKAPDHPDTKKLIALLQKHRDRVHAINKTIQSESRSAEARLKKLGEAAEVSMAAFTSAFAKTRKVFARATRKSGKVIRRAVR